MGDVDPLLVAVVSALLGASASLGATLVTLVWTRHLDQERHEREWDVARSADRRMVYGRFLRAVALWREAAADLEGKPGRAEWDRYWQARIPALEAATELSLVAPPSVVESTSEAMDELLDISWDYDVNGSAFVQAALWNKIRFIDSEVEKVYTAARAEFQEGAPLPRPRRWTRKQKPAA